MKIYKLEINIDGYGGHLKDRYFTNYQKAKNCLSQTSGIYHAEDGTWDVYGMKSCNVYEENDSFSLIGIQFPKEEWDEWCIRYCRATITPIELNFTVLDNEFYLLKYCRGYNHWLYSGLNGHHDTFEDYDMNNQPAILGYYISRKKARKMAARDKSWKKIGRAWVRPEFDKKCSTLGGGQDYLSIDKVVLE